MSELFVNCPECKGTGIVFSLSILEGGFKERTFLTCNVCNGAKTIPEEDREQYFIDNGQFGVGA